MNYLAVLIILVESTSAALSYSLFAELNITLPSYIPEEREYVAKQIEVLLDVYVNVESKIQHYGIEHPKIRAKKLTKEARSMSDRRFHEAASLLFTSLRDLHTTYILPRPYSCYSAVYPLQFDLIDAKGIYSNF